MLRNNKKIDILNHDINNTYELTKFTDSDIIETELGKISVKEACEKRVEQIFSSVTKRNQEYPLANRRINFRKRSNST